MFAGLRRNVAGVRPGSRQERYLSRPLKPRCFCDKRAPITCARRTDKWHRLGETALRPIPCTNYVPPTGQTYRHFSLHQNTQLTYTFTCKGGLSFISLAGSQNAYDFFKKGPI